MKQFKPFYFFSVITVLTFFLWSSSVFGYGDSKEARKTLVGIETINILVDWDGQGITVDELKSGLDNIEKAVFQRLKEKGINAKTSGKIDTPPYLYVEMHSFKCGKDVHSLYVCVKFIQTVSLKTNPSISSISPTWSSGGIVGIIPSDTFVDVVGKLVDEFSDAYLSVNQKNIAKESNPDQNKGI